MRVGFIGIGNMGWPMATHIAQAGHELTVFDVDARAERPLRAREQLQGGGESRRSRGERNHGHHAADGEDRPRGSARRSRRRVCEGAEAGRAGH